MKEEFIPYEQALSLKELGFNEPSFKAYDSKGVLQKCTSDYWDISSLNIINEATTSNLKVLAPTFSQAFRWFREKYKMFHTIIPADLGKYEDGNPNFHCGIYTNKPVDITYLLSFTNYEEAELDCLKKLIEIVKEKK